MKIQIKYFASLREALGPGGACDTRSATIAQLRDELIAQDAAHAQALARSRPVRAALNQTMSDEAAALSEGCEVAFFPPVTGG